MRNPQTANDNNQSRSWSFLFIFVSFLFYLLKSCKFFDKGLLSFTDAAYHIAVLDGDDGLLIHIYFGRLELTIVLFVIRKYLFEFRFQFFYAVGYGNDSAVAVDEE